MAKAKISYVCQECGYDTPSWLGKCPECNLWNSFKEIKLSGPSKASGVSQGTVRVAVEPQKLRDIVYNEKQRIQSEFQELNTVLGGGIVLGSAILLAGDPGIGKSTLLLQLCMGLARVGKKIFYVSGEESIEQIKMRAVRLQEKSLEKKAKNDYTEDNLFLVSLSDPDSIVVEIEKLRPDLVIIDSIQTMQSENAGGFSGSVSQVRYAALHLIRSAKQHNIPVIIVGHVTKEGMVAGPMVLSHMVDTVLFLEGEKFAKTRILRSLKNRFGPIDEVGIFQMEEHGMQEVTNPEQMFLSQSSESAPGSVLVVTLEGSRAFLVELQALVVTTRLPMPRRVVSGVDGRRVELLLAVLQKHIRLPVETMDVFVNVAGGLKVSDPGIDLGICLAVYSSLRNVPLSRTVGIGEVGLLGELRTVSGMDKRIKEAEKLGYKNILSAKKFKYLSDVFQSLIQEK